jgi:WD40 repeat protein
MVFFPDGKTLATAGWDGTSIVWDVALQKPIARLGGQKNSFDSIALSADGRRLAAGGGDGSIKIWDVQTWQEVATLRGPPGQGHIGEVYQLAFWPDGGALVSLSANQLRVWRAPSFAEIEAAAVGKGSPR